MPKASGRAATAVTAVQQQHWGSAAGSYRTVITPLLSPKLRRRPGSLLGGKRREDDGEQGNEAGMGTQGGVCPRGMLL